MSSRLFVAVELDDEARDVVAGAIESLHAAGLEVRFAPRDRWHATIAFLGPVEPKRYGGVLDALHAGAAQVAPFEFDLDAVGAFPNPRRPRVVWVGSSKPQPAFASCAGAVRKHLAAQGFEFDDEAVPHVTICRLKHGGSPLPAVTLSNLARVRVDSLTLYESTPAGPSTRHEVRERFRLCA